MLTLRTYKIILELAKEADNRRLEDWKEAHRATVLAQKNPETTMAELKELKEKEKELYDRCHSVGISNAIYEFEKEDNIILSWR